MNYGRKEIIIIWVLVLWGERVYWSFILVNLESENVIWESKLLNNERIL